MIRIQKGEITKIAYKHRILKKKQLETDLPYPNENNTFLCFSHSHSSIRFQGESFMLSIEQKKDYFCLWKAKQFGTPHHGQLVRTE